MVCRQQRGGTRPGAPGRRGFTLLEVILAAFVTALLAGAMVSAMLIAGRGVGAGAAGARERAHAGDVLAVLDDDLLLAVGVEEISPSNLTVSVPDRDQDGAPETIEYRWLGGPATSGDLTRRINDGPPVSVVTGAHAVEFIALERSVTPAYHGTAPDPGTWGYFLSGPAAGSWMTTGRYTGDGSDDRSIAGLGFAPDLVIVKADSNKASVARSSTMAGDASKPLALPVGLLANRIQSLDDDGFTVGSDHQVNEPDKAYDWVAFKSVPGLFVVGTYVGTGGGQSVAGVGFEPDGVIVMGEGVREAWQRLGGASGTQSVPFSATAAAQDRITGVHADGFTVGPSSDVNAPGAAYHHASWKAQAGRVQMGAFTGDGAHDLVIGNLPLSPRCVFVKARTAQAGAWRTSQAEETLNFTGDSGFSSGVRSLNDDGFILGDHAQVNQSGVTCDWVAFGTGADTSPPNTVMYHGVSTATAPGSVNAIAIGTPPGTVMGDLLIAVVATDGDAHSQPAAPGWTKIYRESEGAAVSIGAWWKLAASGEPASTQFQWGGGAQQAYAWMMRFSGHDPGNPIADKASKGGSSSNPECPDVNVAIAGTLVLRLGAFDGTDITPGQPGLPDHAAITMGASGAASGAVSGGAGWMVRMSAVDSGKSKFNLTASEQFRTITVAIGPAPAVGE
jgi:hypothetical protein